MGRIKKLLHWEGIKRRFVLYMVNNIYADQAFGISARPSYTYAVRFQLRCTFGKVQKTSQQTCVDKCAKT